MDAAELKEQVGERMQTVREWEEKAERAAALGAEVESLKRDVARFQKRHAAFAALGDERVELPHKSYDQRFNMFIEWEPIRSKKTGRELAAEAKDGLDYLTGEIAEREQEIKRLLAA